MKIEFKKQTAVEWLETQIRNFPTVENLMTNIDKLLIEANQINIEQLKDAYGDGLNPYRTDFCNRDEYFTNVYGERS